MKITEVRIKLILGNDRLQAFCSAVFDNCFVVYDIKIIKLPSERLYVSMPDRPNPIACGKCDCRNVPTARYCNFCGYQFRDVGRMSFISIAHPIENAFRQYLCGEILAAYQEELKKSQEPGYESRYRLNNDEVINNQVIN